MDKPERLELKSVDGAQLNLDALYQIAPSCFTEAADPKTGKIKRMVNFDTLRQLLGDDAVEDAPEAYEFNWVGKQAARAEVLRPINKTLRPVKEDSVDWDNTQNLYIEGDNLEVLKLLQKSYLGKVKMIYIDPPYNTGNDFVYHDDFARSQAEEDLFAGNVDELGNRFIKNTDSNGRYHSDWCSMIYSRLMVARSLLTEDGVIYISINDTEQKNLRNICDEVFGGSNFVADLIWANKEGGGSSDSKLFRIKNEHIICYAKNIELVEIKGTPITNADRYKGKDEYYQERGPYYLQKLGMGSIQYSASLDYRILCPDGTYTTPMENNNGKKACWRWSRDKFYKNSSLGFVDIKKDPNGVWIVYTKQYMNCDNEGNIIERTQRPMGIIEEYSSTQAAKMLKSMEIPFDYSKPIDLLKYLIDRQANKDLVVLDFFSGSSSTAHAVMQLNAEDGGNRKFIMVQLPEETTEDSEAYKAGYKNICEIGKERIRRAGKKIKEENPLTTQDLDTGFRVFRVDSNNYEEVEHTPKEWNQQELDLFLNNIKSDRTDLDLLFGCMLDWGVQLSLPMTTEEVDGKNIYTVNEGDLVACFADKVTDNVVRAMAEKQPLRVIFRDSCFERDADKINIYETFKQLMDWSDQEVVKNIRVI
ncbi:site-specific DNA-methyltransferase [Leyella stercorea]|uniref:site-specific DNA-methyltransferase n=1 Tax=Leyella stercorea TaxID=363265 RepID=UPI001F29FD91|nr:site-specific DNA-methyltransferase [Leyella stercorea]MCF2615281.1 site-specific DNA-methyltransferase [Leyella stercorea]